MSVHGDFDYSKVTIYLVGGFVRDHFMGVEAKDKDYVVVGSSPEEMTYLGFTKVGADFPVFLHPTTKDEYALARTERKSGSGYNGFECEWTDVTIEEDLSRRDLTVNSIAWDCSREFGKVIDPFNGVQDIKDKVLRHTSKAFSEDPLRILRVARFLSRFGSDWSVAEDTTELMFHMTVNGELKHLTPERVFKETEKALSETIPSLYFDSMRYYDIFHEPQQMVCTEQKPDHHPEGDVWKHTMLAMDYAAVKGYSTEVIMSIFTHDFGKPLSYLKHGNFLGHEKEGLEPINVFCDKWKVPNKYRELALLVCESHTKVHGVFGKNGQSPTRPKSILKLFENTSALTKPERFLQILQACESDARGRGTTESGVDLSKQEYKQKEYLLRLLRAAKEVDTKTISSEMLAKGKLGVMIGEQIRVARIDAIRQEMKLWNNTKIS